MSKNPETVSTKKGVTGKGRNRISMGELGAHTAHIYEKWRPANPKPRPIVGKPNPFIMESVNAFAKGEITREELSYRLRTGHAKGDHSNWG